MDLCETREVTEVFKVKGRLTESSLFRYLCVSDQFLFQEKFEVFETCDMNVFLPIASCLFFSSSYNPLLLHPSPDVEMAHHFSFSNSLTCPGDTTPSPNLFYAHPFRLPQGHRSASSPLHLAIFPSVIQTSFHLSHLKKRVPLLILCAMPTAAHLPSRFPVKFIDSSTWSYFSSVLSGILPGWLSSLPLHLTALAQHPVTTK